MYNQNSKKNKSLFMVLILFLSVLPIFIVNNSVSAKEVVNDNITNVQSVYSSQPDKPEYRLNADPSFIKPGHAKPLTKRQRDCLVGLGFAAGAVLRAPNWGTVALAFGPAVYKCYF